MSRSLEGKIALVTGGSRGIGLAISERLAADGALVGVHYGKNKSAAEDVVQGIEAKGGKAFAIGADLAAKDGVTVLYAALDRELQARTGSNELDIVVNNAAIAPFASFEETTEAVLDEIYTVNVRAPFFITQEATKRIRDGGRIVFISSGVVRTPFPAAAAYSALKPPLDNLVKTLAVVLGPRSITVNAVSPGAIATDMGSFLQDPAMADVVKGKQALKRIGQADDIADVVAFVAGADARWVTGQVIEASGGTLLTF
jgi:NAD(P)-dependent dehydrogenase (short-subunit alcohol dehydrogenase family)